MRAILLNLFLFLLPFIIYAAYVSIKNQSLATGGDWNEKRIAILSAIGVLLMATGLVIWRIQDSGEDPVNPLLEFDRSPVETEPESERPKFGGPF